jgi:hypothetical protein
MASEAVPLIIDTARAPPSLLKNGLFAAGKKERCHYIDSKGWSLEVH